MKTTTILLLMFLFWAPIFGNAIYVIMGGTNARYLYLMVIPIFMIFTTMFYVIKTN